MMPTFLNATDGVNPTDQVPPPFDGSPNSPTPSESGFELVEEESRQKQQQMDGEADNQQKMDKILEKLRVANVDEHDQKVADYQKNAQPMDTFRASAPKRVELAKKLESKGILYVRHHQQLKNALCDQKKSGKNGPTENFVLFSNKPNSTPDTLKQFFLALHYLFKLAEAQKNCLFVDLELFSDVHKKTQMPKVISNSLDVFPLIGARLIRMCGDQLVTDDWVAKKTQTLGMCIARTSDPKKIPSPVDQLLWPCHLPCPRAKKFGGKCPNGDHFWGCEQCGQTFKFAKQKNDDMGQKTPITHLFCDCGGTRVDRLTFRCAFFADHGDQFNAFTSVNLLNRELERQSKKEMSFLLLEGKTGNGKSTLINAMHFYAQYDTFEDALRLATLADFNSDSLAPASYSKSMLQNGKLVKIEAKLGNIGRKSGESQTQISAAYIIQAAAEDGQLCLVFDTPGIGDTRGIEMDTQNTANTFGFLRGYDALHGVGTVLKGHDNRADESFKYCVNDGILSNLHKNGAPNIVFLITHSSGLGKAIDVVGELLKEIEEENGVKIPLNESNVFAFDNAPFEALCLIKAKGVEYDEDEMEEFSRKWTKSVRQFKRLMKHLATVKPHLTRETLSVYAARCAIADIMPIIASNGAQIQNNIVNREIEELNKTIDEDKKKAEIKFDKVVTEKLKEPLMVCTSEKCEETVKTLGGDVPVPKRKDCAFDYSFGDGVVDSAIVTGGITAGAASGAAGGALVGALGGPVGAGIGALVGGTVCAIAGIFAGTSVVVERWGEKECKKCGCCRRKHKSIYTEQVVKRNVEVDPAVLARIKEKYNKLSMKEAFKQQMIEERDFCYKEPVKWISFLKSSAVKTFDDEMLKYIEQSIRDAEGKMAKLVGQFRDEQQKSIDALRKFKEFYIKERTLFETAPDNAEEFEFPTENVEQIFDRLFALEITGKQMKANYEVVKKAKREHQRQFTAEEERRAAKQNLVKAKPTKCQSASNQMAIQCYLDEMIENGQQQLGQGWKADGSAGASSNVGMTGGGESEGEEKGIAEFGV